MRMHIELDDGLVAQIDLRAGPRNRSRFVRQAVASALEDEERWETLLSARGTIGDQGHEWDADPAAWVREQRNRDNRRVG
jgi:Arc/MetJ family transcription regulator